MATGLRIFLAVTHLLVSRSRTTSNTNSDSRRRSLHLPTLFGAWDRSSLMCKITSFRGFNSFLSNFHRGSQAIWFDGDPYETVEHAYQAAKCARRNQRALFRTPGLTPGQAKRMGRNIKLRDDWDEVKIKIMLKLLRNKFTDPVLKKLLIDTGQCVLIEENTWGDFFWGVCAGVGQNALGKLLMLVRSELSGEAQPLEFEFEVERGADNA